MSDGTTYTITISGTPSVGEVGIPYSFTPTTTGDTVTAWAVTAGSLPAGLSLNPASGTISGTPTEQTTATFTLTASSANTTQTANFTLGVVSALSLDVVHDTFENIVNETLSLTLATGAGGTAPYTYAMTTSAAGLSIDSATGIISGKVTTSGSYTIDLTVTDAEGSSANHSGVLTIDDVLSVSYTSPSTVEVGETISLTPTVSGGKTSKTFSCGTLPNGITIDPNTGVISGVLGSTTSFQFTVSVTDGLQTVSANVASALGGKITFTNTNALEFDIGGSVAIQLLATGGTGALTYTGTGDLPAGVTYNPATSTLSGSPTTMVNGTIVITATDSLGVSASQSYPYTTVDNLSLTGDTSSFYLTGTTFTFIPTVLSGASTRTFSLKGTSVPDTITVDPKTGVISGSSDTAQVVSASLSVTDGYVTKYLPLVFQFVNPLDVTNDIGNGELNNAYTGSITCSGGYGGRMITRITGTPPAGITESISQDGVALSGTPTALGTTTLVYSISDGTGSQNVTAIIDIVDALALDVSGAPDVSVINGAYTYTPQIIGGQAPVTLSYTGTLPKGILLNSSTGTFSGVPTITGVFPITIRATDALGHIATQNMDFQIVNPIQVSYTTLTGVASSLCVGSAPTITGGVGARSFALAPNSPNQLPAGLSINALTGVISGTPLVSGTYEIWVVASDESGSTTSAAEITIYPMIAISGVAAIGTSGSAYSFTPTISGGLSDKYQVTVNPALPEGLTINPQTGVISGTPTDAQTATSYTMVVSDTMQTKSFNFQLTILNPLTAPVNQTLNGVYGHVLTFAIQSSGGNSNLSFVVQSGSFPNGLELDGATGIVSGTPVAVGTGSVYVRIDGPANQVVTRIDYTIAQPLTISGSAPTGYIQQSYKFVPTTSGGLPGKVFTLTEINPIPAGLAFDNTTGTVSGTPTESCTREVTITVSDGLTTASLDVRFVVMATGSTTTGGTTSTNEDVYIQTQCDAYVATMSTPKMTEALYVTGLRTMLNVTMALFSYPTLNALNSLWALHVKYKNTFFLESNFFRGNEGVTSVGITNLSDLYTAYRAACAYPTIPFDFTYLDTRVGNNTISQFLKAKKTLMAKNAS